MSKSFVKSISESQEEILSWILELYVPSGVFDWDPTYSKGQFYASGRVPEPRIKSDITPQAPGVLELDFVQDSLFLEEGTAIQSIIFDPPFLATKGPSLAEDDGQRNQILTRFGTYPTEKELHKFYAKALAIAWTYLEHQGILVFKCQDKVSSGKQYLSHVFIINAAQQVGFTVADLFVLTAKSRMTPDWQKASQKHARKFHSYFLVLRKGGKAVTYL